MTFFLAEALGAGSTAGIVDAEVAGAGSDATVDVGLSVATDGADGATVVVVAGVVDCPGLRN